MCESVPAGPPTHREALTCACWQQYAGWRGQDFEWMDAEVDKAWIRHLTVMNTENVYILIWKSTSGRIVPDVRRQPYATIPVTITLSVSVAGRLPPLGSQFQDPVRLQGIQGHRRITNLRQELAVPA